ncbi:MAG: HlyC/CorC family transporter [Phycisphaeraceae bacterium]|nr:HlyC/CorC family transporter [Phycisphaeraceae bacterium]
MIDPAIWVGTIACLLGCYFSACNIAIKTFSRLRLNELLADRIRDSKLQPFLQRSARVPLMTGTFRTGLNFIVLLSVLSYSERHLQLEPLYLYAMTFIFSSILVSIFSVAIALSWARYKPEAIVAWSIPLLTVLLTIFTPMVAFLHLFDPIVRRVSGAALEEDNAESFASDEVMSVVEEHESVGSVDSEQKEMIEAVFDLSDTLAGEIMTPRTDIEGIEYGTSLDEIRDLIIEAGHSRVPVYGENFDDILGVLYVKDLIRLVNSDDLASFDLKNYLRDVLMIPESKSVRDLLGEFKATKVHIAIVLDEYGGTAGLVTIEDILEELVGEIEDEYEEDEERPSIRKLDDRLYEVDARVDIDDFNDELQCQLPDDEDYETVGGFVFSTLGHVPNVGESFTHENLVITVTGAEKTKVLSVQIQIQQTAEKMTSNGH